MLQSRDSASRAATFYLLVSISLGPASVVLAQDCPKPLSGPNMNLKDKDIVLDSFPNGTRATFECVYGYEGGEGSRFITCTAGSWSALTLQCDRKYCGAPPTLLNGNIDVSRGVQHGDKASVRCNVGFNRFGTAELSCDNGDWTPHPPVCEAVVCNPPPTPKNATYGPIKEKYKFGETIQYQCLKDHDLNGSRSSSCSEDKTFKPAPPLCPLVSCPDLDVDNADVRGSRPPHRHRASVTVTCSQGFKLVGSSNLICGINSRWSAEIPSCRRETPTVKTTRSPTTVTPAGETTPPTGETTPPTGKTTPPTGEAPNTWSLGLGIALGVLAVIAIVSFFGCYYGGFPVFIRKKRNVGSRKNNYVLEGVEERETVDLSRQAESC